jgi:hypothetical protein
MERILLLLTLIAALALAASPASAQPLPESGIISASPSHVHFGSVSLGQSKGPVTVTLTGNQLCCSTWMTTVTTNFPPHSGFHVDSNSCPTFPTGDVADLFDPGDSCTMRLSMDGVARGYYRGTVTVGWGCCHGLPATVITMRGATRPG